MPIILDVSETKKTSNTPKLKNPPKIVKWLEDETGADMAITPVALQDIPFNKRTLPEHITAGALLIQIKNGHDLPSSVGDRMNRHLAKMCEITPMTVQRVLLYIGTFDVDSKGYALINEKHTYNKMKYNALAAAIEAWQDRGGRFSQIHRVNQFNWWTTHKEEKLIEYRTNRIKLAYPDVDVSVRYNDDPLQQLKKAPSGLAVLLALPGIGRVRAEKLWAHYNHDLALILEVLTDLNIPSKKIVGGVGIKTIEKIRSTMKLIDDEELFYRLAVIVEEKTK